MSTLLSGDAAALASVFRSPRTFVEALRTRADSTGADASTILESAAEVVAQLVTTGVLVSVERSTTGSKSHLLAAGTQFDRFMIEACVQSAHGSGVYRAVDEHDRVVALKLAVAGDQTSAARVAREGDILGLISGTVAPSLVAAGSSRGCAFVATAWCQGVDLATAARSCRLLPDPRRSTALLELASSVLQAYGDLHRLGVVHGDIHPKNVIVGADVIVKLIDFGYARLLCGHSSGEPPGRAGVTFYFEPEFAAATLRGAEPPAASVASEQYALGVLLYTLFTGADYIDFNLVMNAALRQIVDAEPLPFVRRSIDAWPPVEAVLRCALSKDPNERFASVERFRQALSGAGKAPRLPNRSATCSGAAQCLQRMRALEAAVSKLTVRDATSLLRRGMPASFDVEHGAAGVATALYRLAIAHGDTGELAIAEVWAHRAVRGAKASRRRRITIASADSATFELLRGESGVHCVETLVAHSACDPASHVRAARAFAKLASSAPSSGCGVAGNAGLLIGCALVLETVAPLAQPIRTSLRECGSRLLMTLPGMTDVVPGNGAEQTPLSRGIERGIAGSIFAALRWARTAHEPIGGWVDVGLRELTALEDAGRPRRVRSRLNRAASTGLEPRPGWRDGSAGMVHLWTLAYEHYHEDRFLDLAIRAAWHTFRSPDRDPSLCQGLTGRAYALLACYRCTGDSQWRTRAEQLADRALRFADPLASDILSLHHGGLGVLLLRAELETPIRARMPMFEDEGWQASPSLSDACA